MVVSLKIFFSTVLLLLFAVTVIFILATGSIILSESVKQTTRDSKVPIGETLISVTLETVPQYSVFEEVDIEKYKNLTAPTVSGLFSNFLISHFKKELTFIYNWPFTCGENRGENVTLLIIVTSAINNNNARKAIRHTWGGYACEKGAKLLFFLGKTADGLVPSFILQENSLFKDIIQGNFVDHYKNMTLKTVSLLKWATDFCEKSKFVLKVDDDVIVNIDLLYVYLQDHYKDLKKSIVGRVAESWSPHRGALSKYYVSRETLPDEHFPTFTTGPAYLLTGDAVRLLFEACLAFPFFHLEDVFITGFVADQVRVQRIQNPKMTNRLMKLSPCTFRRVITVHKYTPKQIENLWVIVSKKNISCRE